MQVPPGKLALIVGSAGIIAAAMMTQAARSEAPATPAEKANRNVSAEERLEALSRAQVWRKPPVPIGQANLAAPISQPGSLSCKFLITDRGGTWMQNPNRSRWAFGASD